MVAARLHRHPAPDRARRARRLRLGEIPRPRLEPVRRRRQRADGADLHRVAREVGAERQVGERHHLRLVAALGEVDEGVAGDFVGEARAPVAQDAALPVEQDEVADRDRLLEVALLLDVAALPRAVAVRLVLQRALSTLVADRAVERMVGEEQLDHRLLGRLGRRRIGLHLHVRSDGDHARRLQHRPAPGVDVDEAHPAHAHRVHPLVVAEPRDVDVVALGGGDDELALARRDRPPVDRDGTAFGSAVGGSSGVRRSPSPSPPRLRRLGGCPATQRMSAQRGPTSPDATRS